MKNFKRLLNLATLVVFLCSNFLIPINYAQWETPVQNRDNVLIDSLLEGETNSQDFNPFSDYNSEIENQNHGITEETTGQKISEQDESSEISEESREELQQISRTMTMKAISGTSVTLLPGSQFNVAIKKLSGQTGDISTYTDNTTITRIIQTENIPLGVTTGILSVSNSTYPVYAWFDNGTIYYYTEAETIYMNKNSSSMFNNCTDLIDISGLSNRDTSKVTSMAYMFGDNTVPGYNKLTDISPLSNWDTSSVTNMNEMFGGNRNLRDISPLSNWDTSNVTNMSYVFRDNDIIDISPISGWLTNNVTNMSHIFDGNNDLVDISPLKGWDINKVTNMAGMFGGCNISDISILSGWVTSKVTNISYMLGGNNITDISPLSNWDTSNVTNMSSMFAGNFNLTDISPLSNWNTSNVTAMSYMFGSIQNLIDISPLSNWDTSKVTDIHRMFRGCRSLKDISPLSERNTSHVTNMNGLFQDCFSLEDISVLSGRDTSNVTDMYEMFRDCDKLKDISPLSNWDTSSVTTMTSMFAYCDNLTDVSSLNNWDTNNVKYMNGMFNGCPRLTELDLTNWDTSSVTNMSNMFKNCNKLETIYVGTGFVVSGQVESDDMFAGAKNLVGGNGTDYDSNHTNAEYARIDTENNPGYFTDINGNNSIVRFETNGGDKLHSQAVEKGNTVNLIDPQKKNATFKGWYIDSGLTENFIESTPIYSNLKLYAKWECKEGYIEESNQCIDENSELINKNGIIKISDGKDTIYLKDRNQGVIDDEIVRDLKIILLIASAEGKYSQFAEECNDEDCMYEKLLDYIYKQSGILFDNIEEVSEYYMNIITKYMEDYNIMEFIGNLYFWGNNTGVNIIEPEAENLDKLISKGFNGGKFGGLEGSGWIEGNYNTPCDWSKGEYLPTSEDWRALLSIWANLKGFNMGNLSNNTNHIINSGSSIDGVTLDIPVLYDFFLDTATYPTFLGIVYNENNLQILNWETMQGNSITMPIAWGGQDKNGKVGLIVAKEDITDHLSISIGTEYLESNQLTEEAVEKINSIALPVRCFIKVPVVKFETNGGSSMDDIDVFKGEKIVLGNQPSKANATFDGWYKDEGLTENWDIENDIVEDDMTLYAKWIEKENKPSGGSSGGGGGGVSNKSDAQKEEKTSTDNSEEQTSQNNKVQESQTTKKTFDETPQDNKQNAQDSQITSVTTQGGSEYSDEFQQAYEFAKGHGITTMPTIQKADMNGRLTRIAIAKMLSQYAINVLGKEPDVSKGTIKFKDVTNKLDNDYDNGVTLAYQLGIMGQNMPNNKFRPNDEVTRAEFTTAFSRMLYGTSDGQYKSTPKYYINHMNKLKQEGIITKDNPKMKELRGYVMIMLMRSAK